MAKLCLETSLEPKNMIYLEMEIDFCIDLLIKVEITTTENYKLNKFLSNASIFLKLDFL